MSKTFFQSQNLSLIEFNTSSLTEPIDFLCGIEISLLEESFTDKLNLSKIETREKWDTINCVADMAVFSNKLF